MRLSIAIALALIFAGLVKASLYMYTGAKPAVSFEEILAQSETALHNSIPDSREYRPVSASMYAAFQTNGLRWNVIFVNKSRRSYNVNTLLPQVQTSVDLYSTNDLYNHYTDADMRKELTAALDQLTESQRLEFYCSGVQYDDKANLFQFSFASGTNWQIGFIVNMYSMTNKNW